MEMLLTMMMRKLRMKMRGCGGAVWRDEARQEGGGRRRCVIDRATAAEGGHSARLMGAGTLARSSEAMLKVPRALGLFAARMSHGEEGPQIGSASDLR